MKHDWNAKQYKDNSEPQEDAAKLSINKFPFKGNEVVLDIGCGDGKITREIAAKVPQGKVIGIDPSKNMIAESKNAFGCVKNLSFKLGAAEDFSFDFHFDLIVSFFALHYATDHKKALKNIFSHLKPGGSFIAMMSGGDQPDVKKIFEKEPWHTMMAELEDEKWNAKTEKEYLPLLEDAGFTNILLKTEWACRYYETKGDLLNWALPWIPYVTGFDEENSLKFANEIVNAVAKGKEKNIEMSSPLLYIEATK